MSQLQFNRESEWSDSNAVRPLYHPATVSPRSISLSTFPQESSEESSLQESQPNRDSEKNVPIPFSSLDIAFNRSPRSHSLSTLSEQTEQSHIDLDPVTDEDEELQVHGEAEFKSRFRQRSSLGGKSVRLKLEEDDKYTHFPKPMNLRDFGIAPNGTLVVRSIGRRRMSSKTLNSPKSSTSDLSGHKSNGDAQTRTGRARKPFPSTKLRGEIYKPWLMYEDPYERWSRWIFWGLLFLGFVGAGVICWNGYASVQVLPASSLCLLMDDDFSAGINSDYWTHEVRVGGFETGEFEWVTNSSNNSFVQDGILYIVPTLTSDSIGASAITNGYTLNLTELGVCTSTNADDCVAVSNSTKHTIINPVQSARLNTNGKIAIQYGKVEVVARIPAGDWIWPAIQLVPRDNVYGPYPQSGLIDMLEARGNNFSYASLGYDFVSTMLHWGPNSLLDSFALTYSTRQDKTKGYHADYHTYGLEWTEKYITTYVDNRVNSIFYLDLTKESFWQKGEYPNYITNYTQTVQVTDPWFQGTKAAPFDQFFYLALDVAVGGTNGWFPNDLDGKPWLDNSPTAMSDFWSGKDQWYATWPSDLTQRGLAVKSVKVWQMC